MRIQSSAGFIYSRLLIHLICFFTVQRKLWSSSILSKNRRVWFYWGLCKKGYQKPFACKHWCTQQKIDFWVPKDGVKCIEKLQPNCANMIFADKSRYGRTFQQVTHKGGEYVINYIKRFQYSHALSVSVGNSYYEDQLMHTFLDNFHQGGKYSAQIASHQA